LVAGLDRARAIGRAKALDPWRSEEVHSGSDTRSGDSLRAYDHPVGTCRIGEDDTAVLDTELRVGGISGLRVADASVMPSNVSGNTIASVYSVAERSASLLQDSPLVRATNPLRQRAAQT
jgi:choline dehydrogenase